MRSRHALIVLLVVAALAAAVPLGLAASQPARPAAQDGFVPVGDPQQQEQLPMPPLLTAAYAVVWIAAFGFLWGIWQRLGRVEIAIADARRRVDGRPRG